MTTLVNRDEELQTIDGALDTLLDSKRLLRTPIVEFYGVEGIGKTVLLEEVLRRCHSKNLKPIWLNNDTIEDTYTDFIQPTRELLKEKKKGVVIIDALDDLREKQLRELEEGLQDLIESRFLFVVLASRNEKTFDTYRSITRKLTSFHLQPLKHIDCEKYFEKFHDLKPDFREVIYEWTRGYPLAMDIMATAIIGQKPGQGLNPFNRDDQFALLSILKKEVINQRLLARASTDDFPRLETLLTLLSVPRRFNLAIMQDIVEEFAPPYRRDNTLGYIALPDEINAIAMVLYWNLKRAGYSIDEPVRNLFLLKLRFEGLNVEQGKAHTYQEIHHFLARKNEALAAEVTGPDHIRYLEEWFYHLEESGEALDSVVQKITDTIEQLVESRSGDLLVQFYEEFKHDQNLNSALGKSAHILEERMSTYLERLKTPNSKTPDLQFPEK